MLKKIKKSFSSLSMRGIAAAVLSVICLLGIAGGAYAYLSSRTDTIENTYEMAEVGCEVDAENQSIKNTSNIPVRIRAAVVVNFYNSNNELMYVPESDYEVTVSAQRWTESGGYYYYDAVVPAGESIQAPYANVTAIAGMTTEVTLLADAIQATPAEAAEDAWGYVFPD